MTQHLYEITWTSVAAMLTLAAVIVALIPIWQEARRRQSYAKGLRSRLCSKLILLGPSLEKVGGHTCHPAAYLSKEEFHEAVQSIATMLKELPVLVPDEQDAIQKVFMNLELAAKSYETPYLTAGLARRLMKMIREAMDTMNKHGFLHRPIETPSGNEGAEHSWQAEVASTRDVEDNGGRATRGRTVEEEGSSGNNGS